MKKILKKIADFFLQSDIMTKKDYLIMGIMTLVFTVLVFIRLGHNYAPETYFTATEENHDIVLDFGDYITVEKLHIYLGNLDSRKLSISTFNEVTGAWEIINSDVNVGSVFQWNNVDIYYTLRYLGIVVTNDDGGVFNEIVCTGPEDRIVTPVNKGEYPELFDEQDKFYKTIEQTYMDGTMFDEVYYGRTGYEFVHHLPTYETTHPQLGKCLIALGIRIFGMTPFGWRFFTALFGALFVPLMYIFAKRLFRDTFIAAGVGIVFTFDCMHYTLSRIATIDIFVAFFIVLSYYYMYKYIRLDLIYRRGPAAKKDIFPPREVTTTLALCGIAMGLAIATKLTGVYAAVGLAIIFLYHTFVNHPKQQTFRLFWFCMLFFIAIPLVLYTLAYIPVVEAWAQMGYTDKTISWTENGLYIGYGWTGLIARTVRNTNYMINYHMNLDATHPYQSAFYTWPFVYRPLLAAVNQVAHYGSVSDYATVNYMGNVAVWWAAIPCVIFTIIRAIMKRDRNAAFLSLAYLAQYLPWFGVSRCVFIYHYFPALLFSLFMMGYTFQYLIKWKPQAKKYIGIYLGVVIIFFFLFFPVISGVPFSYDWSSRLKWFDTWSLI